MANDVASLTTIIQADLTGLGGASAITSAMILTEIQAAIKDYEAYRFYFNEKRLNVTFTATQTYALSLYSTAAGAGIASDIVEVDNLAVTVNTHKYNLDPITFSEWEELNSNTAISGYPTKFAMFNQSVYIYPTPNGVFLSTMAAHVRFTEVTTGTDTSAWFTDGRELIRRSVLKRIYGSTLKDMDQAQIQALAEQQALAALQRRTDALSGHRIRGYL